MKTNKLQLTPHQFTIILIGSMLGVEMLSLPNDVVKIARQDGWISAMLGGVYPIYMILIANFFMKKHPDVNVLILSKMCFGKIIGTILNFIFVTFFIATITMIASGVSNIIRVHILYYLTNDKVLITIFLIPAFIVFNGLKTLGRMNEVIFYLTIPLFLIPLSALKDGDIQNIMPMLGSGIINIFKSIRSAIYPYSGIEVVFLLYPFLNNKSNMKSSTIISVSITMFIYMWLTFVTIYFLGIYITPKFLWPVITATENITIAFITSFRFIAITLWLLICLKIISVHYYASAYGLSEIIKKLSTKQFVYIIYPIFFFLSRLYGPPTIRATIVLKLSFFYTFFNIAYISIIAITIYFKKGDKYVKQTEEDYNP